MHKILVLCFGAFFLISCGQNISKSADSTQTKVVDYTQELDSLRKKVEYIYKNDSTKVQNYVLTESKKQYQLKADDFNDDNEGLVSAFSVLSFNEQIFYIKKEPISMSGDWVMYYEYFFDKRGRLIGAEKVLSTFSDDGAIECTIKYCLNGTTDKLERQSHTFKNEKGVNIPASKARQDMIITDVDAFEDIKFRTLDGFYKQEKINFSEADKIPVKNLVKITSQDRALIKFASPNAKDAKGLSEFIKFYEDKYGHNFFSGVPNFYYYYEIKSGSPGIGIHLPLMLDTRDGQVYNAPEVWATCANYGNKYNGNEFELRENYYIIETCDEKDEKPYLYKYIWNEMDKKFDLMTKK